jgi:hypothetical protein
MRACIILLNYKRPQNLPRIVSACLRSDHRPDVYVLDNAPDDSLGVALEELGELLPAARDRLHYRPFRANRGSGERYSFAATLDYDAFLSIDDDTFLTPAQIDALFAAYMADTECVHGIWGERQTIRDREPFLLNGVHGRDTRVRIVNRVYAFGPHQAKKACELLEALGYSDWLALGPGSDIVLSFSGKHSPMVHDVGPIMSCETSDAAGIAVWRREDFKERRFALLRRLREMQVERISAGRA